jgi:predicted secreted Zn-dependent protease
MKRLLCVAGLAALMAGSAPSAPPTERITTTYYDVTGSTAEELKKQMARKGPKGFWAYTNWYVSWSGDCKVELEISYTFPRLADRNRVPLPMRSRWDAMLANLIAHEEQHGQHGRSAAEEVLAAECNDAKSIVKKWAAEDKAYDKRTSHGLTEGVKLDR